MTLRVPHTTQGQRVDVWQTAGFRRVLFTSDVLANCTTLFFLAFGIWRLRANLPDNHRKLKDFHLGPQQPVFSLFSAVPAYLCTSVLPLVWQLRRPESYFKHRTAVVTAIRVFRLVFAVMTLGSYSASAPTLARISVARALKFPHKALGILLVQPQAYYGHHILYLLPWQFAALFQVATAVAVLHWFAKFPCYTPALGSGATYPWQLRASQACSSMQSYSALLRSALGAPLSEFSLHACSPESGADALQVLQVFCTLVCLVLVPISISHELERWMRLRYMQQLTPPSRSAGSGSSSSSAGSNSSHGAGSSSTGAGAGSSSQAVAAAAGSSANWVFGISSSQSPLVGSRGSSSVSSDGIFATRPPRDINSLSMVELQQLTDRDLSVGSSLGHAFMLVFVMLLVVPALWLLSEALAELFAANRDCAAVLGGTST